MFDFFKKKPFALYITDTAIQVMQLSGKSDNAKIEALGQQNIPAGIVVNGEIVKKIELAETLNLLLKQTLPSPIRTRECLVTLPETLTYEYAFYFPQKLANEEIKQALEQKISLTIPIPFDALHYNYFVQDSNEAQIAFVAAVKKNTLSAYNNFLQRDCKLEPLAFEPECLSIIRNWKFCFSSNQGSIFIYFKDHSIGWLLFWNGLIFDSNSLSLEDRGNLVEDLKQSIASFQKTTNFRVESVFVANSTQDLAWLKENILSLSLPITECPHKLIDFKNFQAQLGGGQEPDNFDIIAGGALRALDNSDLGINLLKK